jgi:flagellar protein FliL
MSAKPPKAPKAPKPKKGKKGAAPEAGAEDGASKAEGEGGEGAEGDAPKKGMSGKNLVLFVVLPVLLLAMGGGGAAVMFLGKKPAEAHGEEKAGEHGEKDAHGKEKKKKKKEKKEGGGHGGGEGGGGASPITEGDDGIAYYELPPILVNIQGNSEKNTYLKLKLSVEFPDADTAEELTPVMPVLTDQFQAFLRELRVDDISGSAGTYRLRMELLRRVNLALAPSQANAILIEEMLVQ